ncbi:MAG: hypothetical protein ACOYOK_01015 [Pseudobdellovibrionaceae bacterium]
MTKYILFLLLLFTKVVWAQTTFVRPYISADQQFYVTVPAAGQWISREDWQVFAFDSALASCGLSVHQLQTKLENFNSDSKKFWQALESVFPAAPNLAVTSPIIILIDDFKHQRQWQRSYHLRDQPNPGENVIVIDCKEFQTQEWPSLLGHELVHALLAKAGAPVWVEEMLAQHIEFTLNPKAASVRLQLLKYKTYLPSAVSEARPFANSETYAMNYLLKEYLFHHMGQRTALRALNPLIKEPLCPYQSFDLTAVICRLQEFNRHTGRGEYLRWLTPESLILNFTTALIINQDEESTQGFYSVPGWTGFVDAKTGPVADLNKMEWGSVVRWSKPTTEDFRSLSQWAYNKYYYVYSNYSYKIFDGTKAWPSKVQLNKKNHGAADEERQLLLLNISRRN